MSPAVLRPPPLVPSIHRTESNLGANSAAIVAGRWGKSTDIVLYVETSFRSVREERIWNGALMSVAKFLELFFKTG